MCCFSVSNTDGLLLFPHDGQSEITGNKKKHSFQSIFFYIDCMTKGLQYILSFILQIIQVKQTDNKEKTEQ